MATLNTSSVQLKLILEALTEECNLDHDHAMAVLSEKNLIPKNMMRPTKEKTKHQRFSPTALDEMRTKGMTEESIAHLTGSGDKGRVVKKDVEKWYKQGLYIKEDELTLQGLHIKEDEEE